MLQEGTKKEAEKAVFQLISETGHEQVVFCHDKDTGLKAIVGIHNTVLGPAIGGTRMWAYTSEEQALHDVLRLSRGMTFKNAIAGLNAGGGKAVIIGDARTQKNEALLRRFGKFIESLSGKYITAEDVGMTSGDMEYIHMHTDFVSGKPEYLGGLGDPSPHTAYGTYLGMKAAAKVAWGSDSLSGKKIAVQGVGSVGEMLLPYLKKEGCKIYASDFYEDRLQQVADKYQIETVGLNEIYKLPVDIYSPCALGATINNNTLKQLKCKVVAGCANNQLADEKLHGEACLKQGIVYAPDFLINCGGVINVYAETVDAGPAYSKAQTEKIYDMSLKVLQRSASEQRNAQEVAMEIAMQRINNIARVNSNL